MSNASSKQHKQLNYGPFSAILVTLLAYVIGAQVVIGIVIGIYAAIKKSTSDQALNYFQNDTTGQFLTTAGAYLGMLGAVYLFMRLRKVQWRDIGLSRFPRLGDFGWACLTFVLYFFVLAIVLQAVSSLIPAINLDQEQQIGFESAKNSGSLYLVFISLVVFPPLVEEILVRGFLYSGLRQKWNRRLSVVVASVMFGIAHLQFGSGAPPLYVAAIDTFILSVFLIGLRERTGSLWAGIAVHALKNGLAFISLFVV